MGSDCGLVVSVYEQVWLGLSPFLPGGLGSFSVLIWWWCLIIQWLELLYELATIYSHWLRWEIRGAAKPLCDSGWSWPRGLDLSLSVTCQYKLRQLCWQPGKVTLLFLCASYNLHHLNGLNTFQWFIINRDTFKGFWLFFHWSCLCWQWPYLHLTLPSGFLKRSMDLSSPKERLSHRFS